MTWLKHKKAQLNFGGLFGSESGGFPAPLAHQVAKNFSTNTKNTTVYTVPAGKKFFITSCGVYPRIDTSGSGVLVDWTAGGTQLFVVKAQFLPIERTFPVPIQIDAGDTITNNADAGSNGDHQWVLEGWEE